MPDAAVFQTVNEPLTVEDIYVDDPGPYEVLVKTMATGVCHSDLHFVEGLYTMETPAVMGHEGAGIVEKVGDWSKTSRRATTSSCAYLFTAAGVDIA